jgi:hypothetical protein
VRGGPNAKAPHTIVRRYAHGRHDRRRRHHFDPHDPGEPCPGVARRLPYRTEVLYVLILVWLIFSGPGPYSIDGLASSEGPGAVPLNELVNRVSISRTGQRRHRRTTDSHCGHVGLNRRAGLRVFSDLDVATPLPVLQSKTLPGR